MDTQKKNAELATTKPWGIAFCAQNATANGILCALLGMKFKKKILTCIAPIAVNAQKGFSLEEMKESAKHASLHSVWQGLTHTLCALNAMEHCHLYSQKWELEVRVLFPCHVWNWWFGLEEFPTFSRTQRSIVASKARLPKDWPWSGTGIGNMALWSDLISQYPTEKLQHLSSIS